MARHLEKERQKKCNMLMEWNFNNLSLTDFNREIGSHEMALVVFTAQWSGASHMVAPMVRKLAHSYLQDVAFLHADADDNQALISHFNINQFPTLLLVREGIVEDKITGIHSVQEIANRIDLLIHQTS